MVGQNTRWHDFSDQRKKKKTFPIAWHESNLINMKDALANRKAERESLDLSITVQIKKIEEYQAQVDRAKSEGKEEFDREKYNKLR